MQLPDPSLSYSTHAEAPYICGGSASGKKGWGAWEMGGAASTRRHQGNEMGKEMHLTEDTPD